MLCSLFFIKTEAEIILDMSHITHQPSQLLSQVVILYNFHY